MRKVVIIFTDIKKMSDFLLDQNISGAEVNSKEQTLIGVLDEDDIITACAEYDGHLNVELKPENRSC